MDVGYFIKSRNRTNDQEDRLFKNYRIIDISNNNPSMLNNNLEKIKNEEKKENKIIQNKITNFIGNNYPFPKISFTPDQNINNNLYYFDSYNYNNNLNTKKKMFPNSIVNTPSRNNKKNDFLTKSININKIFTNNIKINFPFFNYNNNIRINNNNIKNNNSKEKGLNNTLRMNTNNNLNNCMTINQEKNTNNNEIINIEKLIKKNSIEYHSRNVYNIKFKFNPNFKKNEINIYNSNHKSENIISINGILNNDKFRYKNRKLFNEKYCRLNNIFSFSNSLKSLKEKEKEKNNKEKEKEKLNSDNNEKSTDIKEKIENKIKKNNFTQNSNSKKLNSKNRENSSDYQDYRYDPKLPLKKYKQSNLTRIFSHKKFKICPKLPTIARLDTYPKPFESKENATKKYLSKGMSPYILGSNLNITTINITSDKFYYTVNKMYRNQLPEYMKHRINWELIDTKKINIQEQKNININFEWKYLSNRLNFKKYKYEPGSNTPSKKYRMVNLFERNYEMGNKRNMFINLISFCDKINLNVFDYVPFTITINYSKDIEQFLDALKEIMNFINSKKNNNDEDLILNRKYSEQFWFDKNYDYLENQYININKNFLSNKNYWIIKPPDLYQGRCIEISNNYNEINKKCKNMFKGVDKIITPDLSINLEEEEEKDCDEEKNNINTNNNNSLYINNKNKLYTNLSNSGSDIELRSDGNVLNNSSEIVNCIDLNSLKNKKKEKKKITSRITCFNEIIIQKYLDNPLLYKKRKFDIRCFVLVDSNLNVFFCKEGHLKGSSELYDINSTNKFIHITNHSLQKKSSKFEQYEYGNEMSYSDFKLFMQEENIPLEKFNKMIEQMKLLVKISFKSVGNKLLRVTPVLCFEIFGYDFILDNDFRPWILEINNNPGLGISSPVIEKLVPRMIDDALRLTIDKVFETKYSMECIDENGKYKSKYKLEGFTDEENVFEFLCNVG